MLLHIALGNLAKSLYASLPMLKYIPTKALAVEGRAHFHRET